jgi:hypothetical protein
MTVQEAKANNCERVKQISILALQPSESSVLYPHQEVGDSALHVISQPHPFLSSLMQPTTAPPPRCHRLQKPSQNPQPPHPLTQFTVYPVKWMMVMGTRPNNPTIAAMTPAPPPNPNLPTISVK